MTTSMTVSAVVLLDTNVIVDLFLQRQAFVEDANTLVLMIEDGKLQASLCANSVTTIDYLLSSALGRLVARGHIKRLLKTFDIAPVNRRVLQDAAESNLKDFEDAVIAESAGAAMTLKFKGTGVGVFVAAGPDTGRIEYRIDQGAWQKQELFTQWSTGLHLPWAKMLASDLTNGNHELELRVSEDADDRSQGRATAGR